MILLWILGWGLGFGGLIELLVDPHGEVLDVWPTAMAFPGLIGGVVFAGLLWVAEGGRRFDEVSLVRVVTWGALSGLAIGALAVVTGAATETENLSLTAVEAIGIATALGAVAAIGSAVFFRLIVHGPAIAGRTG
jgi:hypothetical protein